MNSVMKEKLMEAIEAKNNDVKTFVWKFAKKSDGSQEEIKLVDASPVQLNDFYKHCKSMLYNSDPTNPGRYVLLNIIEEQRSKCNIELFLRNLESGTFCADKKPYPRYLYAHDLRTYINNNIDDFPLTELKNISISAYSKNLPREFARISIEDVLNACSDQLGIFDTKHITFSFILNLGIYLTSEEIKELDEKDANGKPKHKPEIIKNRLGINPNIKLTIKPTGLNYSELKAMVNLKTKKYSELTTNQLTVLRNKVLFKLENEVLFHVNQWQTRMQQILKVAEYRNIKLEDC